MTAARRHTAAVKQSAVATVNSVGGLREDQVPSWSEGKVSKGSLNKKAIKQ